MLRSVFVWILICWVESKRTAYSPCRNLGPSAAMSVNISTLALKGSSHASGEDLSDTESSEEVSDQGGGEGEPLIKAPFTLTLSVQEDFEAMVVYVESPSFMFLQRLDCQAELDTLSVEIEQYCASFAEKQHQEIFQEGDLHSTTTKCGTEPRSWRPEPTPAFE